MLDVVQIAGDGVGSKIWAGVGGGVQMNIVNAKFETGYSGLRVDGVHRSSKA